MKRKPNNTKKVQPAKTISPGRLWCFRLLALLFPLLALALLELALLLAGYGYPSAFFLAVKDQGRAMLTDNPKFGWRFFPPAVARAPRPLYLAAHKPPDTIRIFVFGESAAMGDPEPAFGFARQLERVLQARHPEKKIEAINAAMTAINSHVIRQIAQDCQGRDGDFWLVFAGNNEVIGPFGAGTIFGRQAPALATVRLTLALRKLRITQLLAQIARNANEPVNWEGLEFFLKWQLAHDDPRLQRVYASFAANLRDVAQLGQHSGATVLLATVPVNLRDFPPLASIHRPNLPPEKLTAWDTSFSAGNQAQVAGRFSDALSEFRKAAEIDDGFAQLAFQRATCELELNQAPAADADFRLARDLDALRFRADSRINDLIRQTARETGAMLVDADQQLTNSAAENLFYDHVHFNFAGNYHMALLFAAEIEKHWASPATSQPPWPAQDEIARWLAFTGFDERRVGQEIRARLQRPPFNSQSNSRARDERWRVALAALAAPAATFASNYQAAVTLAPADWLLHADFARLLDEAGDRTGAATQWAEVSRLLPHSPEGWANQGRLARIAGDNAHARNLLRKALDLQPDSVETLTEFGNLEAGLGRSEDARRQFRSALRLRPGFSPARVNLGLLLARQGNAVGAAAEYRETLRWQTNNIEARINLANLLAAQGGTAEACALLEQAISFEPENSVARYNFGRLLVTDHPAAAITNLQVALHQCPNMGEIHFELGQALARLGRDAQALDHFAQAARLTPDHVDAHLNYGVALARSGRYSEAIAEFRQTLRLRPLDPRAQQMLEQAARSVRSGTGQ